MLKRKYVDTVELQDRLFGKLNNGNPLEDALCKFFAAVVDETPAANVVEERHGIWEKYEDEYEICATEFVCSNCKECFTSDEMTDEQFVALMKHCPNCGCKMDKEANDE